MAPLKFAQRSLFDQPAQVSNLTRKNRSEVLMILRVLLIEAVAVPQVTPSDTQQEEVRDDADNV